MVFVISAVVCLCLVIIGIMVCVPSVGTTVIVTHVLFCSGFLFWVFVLGFCFGFWFVFGFNFCFGLGKLILDFGFGFRLPYLFLFCCGFENII